jgi:penicillin-binding protein 2
MSEAQHVFERRLKVGLAILAIVLAVLVVRLAQLQIVHADYYRQQAEQSLIQKSISIPFTRGRILDRFGEPLVGDEPCWEIRVDFNAIAADAGDSIAMSREIRRARRLGWFDRSDTDETAARSLRSEFQTMWQRIDEITDSDRFADSRRRARDIYVRIGKLRRTVAARRGFESPVAEEHTAHAVVTGLDRGRGMDARAALAPFPWVQVTAATTRAYAPLTEPFAHILGRLGAVSADDLADDPEADDPFSRYLPDDLRGVSGVEWLAERMLRGRRGRVTLDRNGETIGDPIEHEPGEDAILTIHGPLQRRLYQLLAEHVAAIPRSSGGSLVVLDVNTREVLALVSYPAFDPARFDVDYEQLSDETERLPLSFRAVANRYAPGSIVKPLVCIAGLANGRITLDAREECRGHLLPDHPDRWRCWEIHGTDRRMAHGFIDVVEALRGSCNVYMYLLGERLGVDGLCNAFDMVGIGRSSGIGFREESVGINPTPDWLLNEKGTAVYPAHARLFAIGQGEISITPLQAAAIAATYATGWYGPLTILRHSGPKPRWTLPGTEAQWNAIRRGLHEVVNHPGGTAHKYAWFHNDRYALCGKTGSATAYSWPTAFRIPFTDSDGQARDAVIRAGARDPAIRRFQARYPDVPFDPTQITVAERWPRDAQKDDDDAHAWFAGFLQPLGRDGRPDWNRSSSVAFAVLVEFGGSGGRVSGPIARAVAEELVQVLGPSPAP